MVVHLDELGNCVDQISDAGERTTLKLLVGELAEPALDEVQPRTTRGREVEVKTRMLLELRFDVRMLVCAIVVEDQMQWLTFRKLSIKTP